jgi:hypothetical protein
MPLWPCALCLLSRNQGEAGIVAAFTAGVRMSETDHVCTSLDCDEHASPDLLCEQHLALFRECSAQMEAGAKARRELMRKAAH